jgi:hypothetical protein
MTSGQDVSQYLDTLGLVKSYFFKVFVIFFIFFDKKIVKKSEKKMSWCSDAPEDEAISLFAGLLPNPDVPLSLHLPRISRSSSRSRTYLSQGYGGYMVCILVVVEMCIHYSSNG